MKDRFNLSKVFILGCVSCMVIGLATFVYGFVSDPQRAWANYLLSNFYFLSLAIGGAFFLALQSITQSGWSSGFRRIPEAMMMYIPVAGVFILIMFFGLHYLYPWANRGEANHEIFRITGYLNAPFFLIRVVLFFTIWLILVRLIRKASLREDETGGTVSFTRIEWYSKIFIFFLAVSFSLLGFDLLMSLETKWFSTIYALKNFIAAFLHGTATVFVIVVLMNRRGYFPFLNASHVHDFARYLFIVSIFYGYFWFSQFLLIWYANIPEETVYYLKRWGNGWHVWWALDIIMNWLIPFFVLLPVLTSRKKWIVFSIAILLFVGLWIDLYVEIFPGAVGQSHFGFMEIGSFIGFAGLFAMMVAYNMSKASVVPKNHPLIEESYQHHFESYI